LFRQLADDAAGFKTAENSLASRHHVDKKIKRKKCVRGSYSTSGFCSAGVHVTMQKP
jgi:hypothetical protein